MRMPRCGSSPKSGWRRRVRLAVVAGRAMSSPRKAGTHNHRCAVTRSLWLQLGTTTDIGGYGSRIGARKLACPGRRGIDSNFKQRCRVGKGARAVPTNSCLMKMVGTRSLASGAHSRDPLALPTLRLLRLRRHCEERSDEAIQSFVPQILDCFASLAMTSPYDSASPRREQRPSFASQCPSKY